MPKPYTHLTTHDRDLIAVLHTQGHTLRAIARLIDRDHTTIIRELARNAAPIYQNAYLPHRASARAKTRWKNAHQRPRLPHPRLQAYLRSRLSARWSPELIAGRWSLQHPEMPVSHEAIYQWVYTDARDLIPYLVRAHRKRFPRGHSRTHKTSHIPNRMSITERPKTVERRQTLGHWESDTAVSRQSLAALLAVVERTSRYTRLARLPRKEAHAVSVALNRRLAYYPSRVRQTLTYDNGSENVEHERTNAVLGTQSYFCTPYHSWEKGTVENTIGLVRRFLPKKTDFARVSHSDVRTLERWLNGRPRKCLNFHTPAEVFRTKRCT